MQIVIIKPSFSEFTETVNLHLSTGWKALPSSFQMTGTTVLESENGYEFRYGILLEKEES